MTMPGRIRHAGLPVGVNNEEIYGGRLGLSAAEMRKLKTEGVI